MTNKQTGDSMRGIFKLLLVFIWTVTQVAAPFLSSPVDAAKEKSDSSRVEKIAMVEGFRSARFGMTESEVKASIVKDFNISGKDIDRIIHPSEKTVSLSVVVPNIVPESGKARVAYIMGYKSKRLIQVNVNWGNPVDTGSNSQGLIGTANALRDHFARRGFKKDALVMNARLSDGSVLVFRGVDTKRRMVVLLLKGMEIPEASGDKNKDASKPKLSLVLSYISDPNSPDIFQIKEGEF